MGEQTRRRPRKTGRRRREPPRFEQVHVDAPPGLSAELAFPYVAGLALGAAPVPPAPRPRAAPPGTRRRRVAE